MFLKKLYTTVQNKSRGKLQSTLMQNHDGKAGLQGRSAVLSLATCNQDWTSQDMKTVIEATLPKEEEGQALVGNALFLIGC